MKFLKSALISLTLVGLSCSHKDSFKSRYVSSTSDKRGVPWEYDAGADKDSQWPDLFGDTPNYRAFGQEVIQGRGEKFRWIFGPMWYRGRLEPNRVKVFVIGQEGAQDENVSNRSFTGSTGTRMQKFLNYLGVYDSYLFMNTFVYTITGQYSLFGADRENSTKVSETQRLRWLAQNKDSIVVEHRHKLFDYMLERNKGTVSLVIGVGTAGKDSAATWVEHHGGKCSSSTLSHGYCEGKGALEGVYVIGVRHPGAAAAHNAGTDASGGLRADFQKKADIVSDLIKDGKMSFPSDPEMSRNFSKKFSYGYAPVPHKDFAFGTNWQMGAWSTTSNRRGQDTIQIFSKDGCYNNAEYLPLEDLSKLTDDPKILKRAGRCAGNETPNRKHLVYFRYDKPKSLITSAPKEMLKGDVPYESPKSKSGRRQYDEGPGDYARDLIQFFDQDYWDMGVTSHQSFGPSGIYRGSFSNAKVLVLADQFSWDDMFSGRALTGEAGQRLQSFLNALGLNQDYLILRDTPVDMLDLSLDKRIEIATSKGVSDAREAIIKKVLKEGNTEIVLTLGEVSEAIIKKLNFGNIPVFNLTSPTSNSFTSNWQSTFAQVKKAKVSFNKDMMASFVPSLEIIPRSDLPAYTRWWMGTSGSRAVRAYTKVGTKKIYNPNYYKVHAPDWAKRWRTSSKDLTSEEKSSLKKFEGSDVSKYDF